MALSVRIRFVLHMSVPTAELWITHSVLATKRRGLLYAPLVPLMSVFSAIAMVLLYSVHKVQAILLYHTETETLGAFWLPEMDRYVNRTRTFCLVRGAVKMDAEIARVCRRILAFLFLSQGLLGLTCGLQNASGKTGMLV